ncbi:Nitrogen regulation protein NR(I) [Verrucomicrobia bacterium]|nr:Nitrogen regulation protein NR(I) [Verrucomicrobiota bacterium]
MHKVLLIDEEADVQSAFRQACASSAVELATAASGEEGLQLIPSFKPDLVVIDVALGGMSGLEALQRIRTTDSRPLVVLMTGYSRSQTAIEAMKLGAYDYLPKPLCLPKLKEVIANALKAAREMSEAVACEAFRGLEDCESGIVGRSLVMQQVFKLIGQVAASDAKALITGESGTGKELVARAIYRHSSRSNQPFLAVNCAAIPEQLLESELFGNESGAFTGATAQRIGKFEQCNGGTLFLDEIGDMTAATQTKILRVLQSGTFERVGGNKLIRVDVRTIAATNQPLEQAVSAGRFREDLFYRLNVVRVRLPPLRERPDDIALLVEYFVKRFARDQARSPKAIGPGVIQALEKYHWPGNVRELENVIRRALVIAKSDVILLEDLPGEITGTAAHSTQGASLASPCPGGEEDLGRVARRLFEWARREPALRIIPAVQRELVIEALKETQGNQVHAALLLGITRPTLRKRLKKLSIRRQLEVT